VIPTTLARRRTAERGRPPRDRRLSRRAPVLAVAVVVALSSLVAGCSSSGGAAAPKVAALPASAVNPVPYDKLKTGGTLRLQIQNYPTQFNFNQTDGPLTATAAIMSALMPTPFLTDANGNPYPDQAYVTSYKVTPASGSQPQVIELSLNDRAHWSDGTPITAADYVAQWKATNGANPAFDPASVTGLDDVASVAQGSSPYQVIYTFSQPFGEWASLFGILYPAQYNASPQEFDNGYLNAIPVTGGPFKLGSLNASAQTVTVVRDPSFWSQPAKLASIVFETLSNDAAVQALANGELDDVEVYNVSEYDKVKDTPGITARVAVSATWPSIVFNGKNPILSDVRVRQALQLAVDRPAVISSQMKGLPVPTVQPLDNHVILPSETGYADESGQYGKYDPAQAEKLLAEAGWTPGSGGVRYKDGQPLKLTMMVQDGDSVGSSIAQLVQVMWKQVGVQLTLQTVNQNDYFQNYVDEGNFQIGLWEWTDTPYPISGSEAVYQQPQGSNLFQNFGSIGSPQIDDLFNQALGETGTAQARATANKADALIWAEGHDLPLYTEPDIEMEKSDLANWGALGLSLPNYTLIGYTS
jgi:peptide/nickel transport system substrate-binding protein